MSKRNSDDIFNHLQPKHNKPNESLSSSADIDLNSILESVEKAKRATELLKSIDINTSIIKTDKKELLYRLGEDGNLYDENNKIIQLNKFEQSKVNSKPSVQLNVTAPIVASVKPEYMEIDDTSSHYDPRFRDSNRRNKKMKFIMPGEYTKQANDLRAKAERRIKGIKVQSLELENPIYAAQLYQDKLNKEKEEIKKLENGDNIMEEDEEFENPYDRYADHDIPDVEWWDIPLLQKDNEPFSYDSTINDIISMMIEHPAHLKPLAEPLPPPPMALPLTKEERKKLKRMRNQEKQREITDKIRLGLMPPPEPKVKLSNMMRVVAAQAVADPSAMEASIKAAAQKRLMNHQLENEKRKLTKEESGLKLREKLKEDTSLESTVLIFKVEDLSHVQHRFKVNANAKQLNLTGCALLLPDLNIVIVEGGQKNTKRFMKLMLRRIKWETQIEDGSNDDDSDEMEFVVAKNTKCQLIWEGKVKKRSFPPFRFESCRTEELAHKCLEDRGVSEYFDLVKNFIKN